MTSTDRWRQLGVRLIQRRTALGSRFHNRGAFCVATGLNYRLVYDIEEARRTNFGGSTLAAFESAYRLAPGAIGRFLAGGELEMLEPQAAPVPAVVPLPPVSGLPPAPRFSVLSLLSREERERAQAYVNLVMTAVDAARQVYPDTRLTGEMIYPVDENSARQWDRIAGRLKVQRAGEDAAPEEIAETLGLTWYYIACRQGEAGNVAGLTPANVSIASRSAGTRSKSVAAGGRRASNRQARPRGRGSPAGAMIDPWHLETARADGEGQHGRGGSAAVPRTRAEHRRARRAALRRGAAVPRRGDLGRPGGQAG